MAVTIQMNSFQQYFHIVLFFLYETSSVVLSHGIICFVCSPNFGGL